MVVHRLSFRQSMILICLLTGLWLIPVSQVTAADNCQHFNHNHWHWFHWDEWLYLRHGPIGGFHYNSYHNTTHGDFLDKHCPGQQISSEDHTVSDH